MSRPRTEVAVGIFVVIGFLILSMIVFFVSGVYFFRPGYHLKAQFNYVGITNPGAPVRFAGVRVGEVTAVEILQPTAESSQPKIEATFFVEQHVVVKEHYKVAIQGNHVMAEPHISIMPVEGEGRVLADGDLIEGGISPYSMEDLFEQSSKVLESVSGFMGNVSLLFEDVETRENMKQTLSNMSALLNSMNEIVVGEEEEIRAVVVNINRVTEQMAELLERINQAEGTLGKFVTDDEVYNNIRDMTRELKLKPWKLLKKG